LVGGNQMSRYARQICLPEIGQQGQDAIQNAHVLVVGVGGLGAPVLQYLVGAGVGKITVVDGDTVDLSNLHRQTLFRETDVGKPKVDAAVNTLLGLNTDCKIMPINAHLTPANASGLIRDGSIVLDCADSFAVSYILSDLCKDAGLPLISASVLGTTGYVGGFCGHAPSLRAVFPDLPDRAATCATAGVMGPVVGMIGAAQAQMALAFLIGQTPSPLGQLMTFDMASMRASSFRFDNAPEPLADFTFISSTDIKPADFVIDLREVSEVDTLVTATAQRINVSEFTTQQLTPAPDQRAVFTCRSGLRAWQAATHLRSYWTGEITLIAMGNPPKIERQKT
jgi:molybdopterin/thiamine biosynthesis adenylyltransferase/rhodanese-related sulfurtransferase